MDLEYKIKKIIDEILDEKKESVIPIEISARHIHLSEEDVFRLFGEGYELTFKRELSQKGQFLSEERLRIIGPKGVINNVAVLGPTRKNTQVELSVTDCVGLGIKPILRESGDTRGSSPIGISFGDKYIFLEEGAIVAGNHIHMNEEDAEAFSLKDRDVVDICAETARPIVFKNVLVRVNKDFVLNMHIDFDEANACMLKKGDFGKIAD